MYVLSVAEADRIDDKSIGGSNSMGPVVPCYTTKKPVATG